jgi:hypothetical protein
MIDWCCTLKQLRHRIDYLIERIGEDAYVGTTFKKDEEFESLFYKRDGISTIKTLPAGEYLQSIGVQVEWVCIDTSNGRIIGDEANDHEMRLKPGEMTAVKLS